MTTPTPEPAMDDIKLPPLTFPADAPHGLGFIQFTGAEMQAYARAAVAADRAREGEVRRLHSDYIKAIKGRQEMRQALRIARDHLDMGALRTSHCKDAAAIESALGAPSAPVGDGATTLEPATEQQKLRDLADRIDPEELWRRAGLDRFDGKMTPEQIDRMDAGVHLRRYSDLLRPVRWMIFPPEGVFCFSASTLKVAAEMAQRYEERRAARAATTKEPS